MSQPEQDLEALRAKIIEIWGLETSPDGIPEQLLEYDENGDVIAGVDYQEEVSEMVRLVQAEVAAAEQRVIDLAHKPCECGRDHFATPVRSVTGVLTTYCQFSRVVPSATLTPPEPTA